MFINFYKTTQLLILLLTSFKLYWFHTSGDNLYLNFFDLLSRTAYGEFYLNLLYFWWTSFWYLPLFVTAVLVFYTAVTSTLKLQIFVTYVITYVIVSYEVLDYWSLSAATHMSTLDSGAFNPLLTNSINKYHPLILYYSIVILVSSVQHSPSSLRLGAVQNVLQRYRSYGFLIITVTTTLALGSWWAVQEGSWGGWWNWDPSEVFGLLIMIYAVQKLHVTAYCLTTKTTSRSNFFEMSTLLSLYFFIQLNFDLVSHNFGTRSDQFIDSTHFLLLSSLVVTFSVRRVTKALLCEFWRTTILIQLPPKQSVLWAVKNKIFQKTLFALILVLLYMSFNNLLNDFFWKTFSINIANTSHQFTSLVTAITVLVLSMFWKSSHSSSGWVLGVMCTPNPLVSVSSWLFKSRLTTVGAFHRLITLFLLINLVGYFLLENLWSLDCVQDSRHASFGHTITTSGPILEGSHLWIQGNALNDPAAFLLTNGLSSKSRTFALLLSPSNSTQLLPTGLTTLIFSITVLDVTIPTLVITFVSALVAYALLLARRARIMF